MRKTFRRPLWAVILCWALCLGCMIFIFSMSSQKADDSERASGNTIRFFLRIFVSDFDSLPEAQQDEMIENWQHAVRKGAHFSIYMILGALFCQAYYGFTDKGGFLIPASVLSSALFAASDELHQLFVPGRSGEIADIALDTAGALLGVLISYLITSAAIKRRLKKAPS